MKENTHECLCIVPEFVNPSPIPTVVREVKSFNPLRSQPSYLTKKCI